MRAIVLGALALVGTVTCASAQQYIRPAYSADWYGVTVSNGAVVSQPHLHTYNSYYTQYPSAQVIVQPQGYYVTPQPVYNQPQVIYQQPQVVYQQPQVTYVQPQSVYVKNPHHTPENLTGYWPFISKAHADRDFNRNWIHVYGGH